MTNISKEAVELIKAARRDVSDIATNSPAKARLATVDRLLGYADEKVAALSARVAELDTANHVLTEEIQEATEKALMEGRQQGLDEAKEACEERAKIFDVDDPEVECCIATAKYCASDIEALK